VERFDPKLDRARTQWAALPLVCLETEAKGQQKVQSEGQRKVFILELGGAAETFSKPGESYGCTSNS